MRKILLFSACMAVTFSAFSKEVPAAHEYNIAVAFVNGGVITVSDLDERLRLLALSMGGISKDAMAQAKKAVLNDLIEEHIKWSVITKWAPQMPGRRFVSPQEVDEEFGSMAERNGLTLEQFQKLLEQHNITVECLKKQILVNRSWINYIKAKYGDSVRVSEAEAKSLQKKWISHKGEMSYHVQRIVIPSTDENALQHVNYINKLLPGSKFQDVARQFSKGGEAIRGGDLGWVYLDQLSKEESQIKDVAIGSTITVRTNSGYSILKLIDKRVNNDAYTQLKIVQIGLPLNQGYPKEELIKFLTSLKAQCKTAQELIKLAKGKAYVSDVQTIVPENMPAELRQQVVQTLGAISGILQNENSVYIVCTIDRETHKIPTPSINDFKNQEFEKKLSNMSLKEFDNLKRTAVVTLE